MDQVRMWRVRVRRFDTRNCSIREGAFSYFLSFEDARRIFDSTKAGAIEAALEELTLRRDRIQAVDCAGAGCDEVRLSFDDAAVAELKALERRNRPAEDLEPLRLRCGV